MFNPPLVPWRKRCFLICKTWRNRYVFIFDYGSDWMIVCYENGVDKKYFNSAEDGWDNSLDYVDMFVENGGNRYEAAIPVCGNRGGQIWDDAKQNLYATADDMEKQRLCKIIAQNDSCGYGWSEVVIDNIVVNDSIVRYGVGNRCISSDVWNGTYFSAADFKLTKIK